MDEIQFHEELTNVVFWPIGILSVLFLFLLGTGVNQHYLQLFPSTWFVRFPLPRLQRQRP